MEGALWAQLPGAPLCSVTITLPDEIRDRFTDAEAEAVEEMLENVTRNSMGVIAGQAQADLNAAVEGLLRQARQSAAGTA